MRITAGMFLCWIGVFTALDIALGCRLELGWWWKSKPMVAMGAASWIVLSMLLNLAQ